MPDLDRFQIALGLAVFAVVLWVGSCSLRGERGGTTIDPGSAAVGAAAGDGGRGVGEAAREAGGAASPGRAEAMDAAGAAPGAAADPARSGTGGTVVVHVAGAVRRPGLYRLSVSDRVGDAVKRAGGGRRGADLAAVNLAALLTDGQQVLIPARRRAGTGAGGEAGGGGATAGIAGAAAAGDTDAPISLAAATQAQLETIDGIGPVTAQKILSFRDSRGGLASIEELDQVPGIGPVTMTTLREALVP